MNFRDKVFVFFATGCLVGKVPFAPGTFGSLLGIPLYYLLSKVELWQLLIVTLLFIVFAIWIANAAEKILGKKDPGSIVIDEIAGQLVTFIGIPLSPFTAVTGFILFRIFDIWKPYPIRAMERKIPGGAGVVMDDVIAGIYGNIALRVILIMVG